MKSVLICVFGRVQGVYFRASTVEKALALQLTGWVRNRLNGSVEILAHGSEKNINMLIAWASNGPSLARVDRIELKYQHYFDSSDAFEIAETI